MSDGSFTNDHYISRARNLCYNKDTIYVSVIIHLDRKSIYHLLKHTIPWKLKVIPSIVS